MTETDFRCLCCCCCCCFLFACSVLFCFVLFLPFCVSFLPIFSVFDFFLEESRSINKASNFRPIPVFFCLLFVLWRRGGVEQFKLKKVQTLKKQPG